TVAKVVYLTMADMGHGGAGHSEHGAIIGPGSGTADTHAAEAASADAHAGHGGLDAETAPAMPSHPPSERRNPGVDMQAMAPTARLDDPGIGLRGNGRRVLTYADLRTLEPDPDGRTPGRTIELHLTGHMERYMWSFDGLPFSRSEPLQLRY